MGDVTCKAIDQMEAISPSSRQRGPEGWPPHFFLSVTFRFALGHARQRPPVVLIEVQDLASRPIDLALIVPRDLNGDAAGAREREMEFGTVDVKLAPKDLEHS